MSGKKEGFNKILIKTLFVWDKWTQPSPKWTKIIWTKITNIILTICSKLQIYQIIRVDNMKFWLNTQKFNIIQKGVTVFYLLYHKKMMTKHGQLLISITFNMTLPDILNIKCIILINLDSFNLILINQWLSIIPSFNTKPFIITSFRTLTIEILTKVCMKNKFNKSLKILI